MTDEENKKTSGNRRCGFSRRSFQYAHHIPERRCGSDRREAEECDLDTVNQSTHSEITQDSSTGNDE